MALFSKSIADGYWLAPNDADTIRTPACTHDRCVESSMLVGKPSGPRGRVSDRQQPRTARQGAKAEPGAAHPAQQQLTVCWHKA
jgi:hypothetical protein